MKGVLTVLDLVVEFETRAGPVRPVDGVSLEIARGEVLGLVGESGCGKTLVALAVLGLLPWSGRVAAGRAFFQDRNLLRLSEPELRALRGRELAIVFQDPLGALHPMLSIELQLVEALQAHARVPRREARTRVASSLEEVGLDPGRVLGAYPHELSGGMRQRVLIAMALLHGPAVLFADEPTTALDAHLQRQVLELFRDLARRHDTAVVLISHDLARVAEVADRVQVLYAGRTAEVAPTRALFERPLHPYTHGLLASAPRLEGPLEFPLPSIPGQAPDPAERPEGCAFHPRCPLAHAACRTRVPDLEAPRPRAGTVSERLTACLERNALQEGALGAVGALGTERARPDATSGEGRP